MTQNACVTSIYTEVRNLDLSLLSEADQSKVWELLLKHESMFSAFEDDLGCTSVISHDSPLLDDIPAWQRYRLIPPLEYEAVKPR